MARLVRLQNGDIAFADLARIRINHQLAEPYGRILLAELLSAS
ncbi:hypothetical protein ACFOY4_00065 [Actinomadura syzygii]